MINITKDLRAQGLDPNKRYRGIVVANDDSQEDRFRYTGRIKVRIPILFDGIEDDDLPWAIPEWPHIDGSSNLSGIVDIPKVGSYVDVVFQDGKMEYPRYVGGSISEKTVLEECKQNYPNRKVTRTKNGCLIIIDTETNELFVRNPGDLKIYVQGNVYLNVDGNVTERIKGDKTTYIDGNYIETVVGNKTVEVKGNNSEKVGGNTTEYTSGSRNNKAGGSNNVFADGSGAFVAGGTLALEGSPIHENSGVGPSAPAAPESNETPEVPEWPGVPENENSKIPTE